MHAEVLIECHTDKAITKPGDNVFSFFLDLKMSRRRDKAVTEMGEDASKKTNTTEDNTAIKDTREDAVILPKVVSPPLIVQAR